MQRFSCSRRLQVFQEGRRVFRVLGLGGNAEALGVEIGLPASLPLP
jgi:hypothetical protein